MPGTECAASRVTGCPAKWRRAEPITAITTPPAAVRTLCAGARIAAVRRLKSNNRTTLAARRTVERRPMMTTEDRTEITLRLEGSRAEHGVSLSDFESFIDSFLAALRDFDRDRRGVKTRKSGHPERRAEAVTAFRLVRFTPGSGVATIEPETLASTDEQPLPLDVVPIAVENLRALVDDVEADTQVSEAVTDALGRACRAFGPDGSIQIDFPTELRAQPARIDLPRLEHLRRIIPVPAGEVRSVSGRLHLLDVEPDKLAIRSSNGVNWTCKYPEELEAMITRLMDRVVWAEGSGLLTSPQRGTMTIDRIEPVELGDQSTLFTSQPVPDEDLLASQGIGGPQGLAVLADPEWDDDADDPYLAALTSR